MQTNKLIFSSLAGGLLCLNTHIADADERTSGTPGVAAQRAVVNFAELARQAAPLAAAPPQAGSAPSVRFSPANVGGTPASPVPASSFQAFKQEEGISYVPDTQAAVGPNHLMVAVNGTLRVQDRLGGVISTVADTNFWASLGVFPGNSTCGPNTEFPIFDPRIAYDPFGQRWILTELSDAVTNSASLLIGVSQTSDPTGNWNLYRMFFVSSDQQWMDFDRIGFNKDWIVVCGAMFYGFNVPTTGYQATRFYVFNKTNLYAGGDGQYTLFQRAEFSVNRVVMPAFTYDPSVSNLYLLAVSDAAINANSLQIFNISGPIGAEVFASGPTVTTTNRWDDLPRGGYNANVLPQLGTTNKIAPRSAFLRSAIVYRTGSLWAAHHIHFPAGGSPQRASIQWWQISPGGTVVQRGLIDDPAGINSFSYASIAVNKFNDVLVGYSRFSSNQYASANYAFRAAADPPGTLRGDTVLKEGESPFYVPYSPSCSGNVNRFGDYSATVVDPVNDSDLWTIQEYAATPSGGQDRWGTWWGHIVPPLNVAITDTTVVEGDAGTTNAIFTASLSRTNDQVVSVDFTTADCTALAGLDYASTNGTIVFNPGETNILIVVAVLGDVQDEGNETFAVSLSNPTNLVLAYTQGTGTILDDDFKVTSLEFAGSDIRLSFTTQTNQTYRVERTESLAAPIVWEPVTGATNVPGTGAVVPVLDIGAANRAQRFYRVRFN